MTNFYGYNIHSTGLRNPAKLLEHIIKVKPAWALTMDSLDLAKQIKAASPDTNMIHRNHGTTNGDDDVHKRYTPQQWLDAHVGDILAGVWIMTTCEPGWSQEVLDWHVALMKLCIPDKVKLVIGNWSVGTPDPGVIAMAKPLLQLCADHPDLFVLGLHEYAGAVITSGFVGGAPDGYTQAHDKQYHPDYQKTTAWPYNGEAKLLTKWHVGRFQFWVDYCKAVGIKPPRIVLTEIAFDAVSDIAWWTNTLPKTDPYKSIAGFKTLQSYWHQIFPQWSHDKAYFKQLEYAANNIYDGTVVEGGCLYCFGHKDVKWEAHDVEDHAEFLGYMETYASSQAIPVTTPAPVTVNVPAGKGVPKAIVIAGKDAWNLRTDADLHAPQVGSVKVGEAITLYHSTITPNGGNNWYYIERATPPANESANGWLAYILPVTAPLPPLPATVKSVWTRLYEAQLKVAQAQFELAQVYKELDSEAATVTGEPRAA